MSDELIDRITKIETDLLIIEANQERAEGMRKILWGVAAAVFIQIIGAAIGYGQLKTQLDDIGSFRRDTATVLGVLKDHGTELSTLRAELVRMRANDDNMMEHVSDLTSQMVDKTRDRYFRSDAIREKNEMREWVELMFEKKIRQHHRERAH